jgi:hypothetical protein
MIWEKAHELFQKEQALTMADDFKGPKRLMQVSLDGYL